nr:D-glycero-beta-D-manno-heptose 1-phosphate adenylyltransferase [Megamonas hypermegale]
MHHSGKSIALTNGSFDLVHSGHVNYLNEAKKMADYLIVGVNSDKSVKQYKSDKRPIISQNQRAFLIDNLKSVDYVVIFEETTADKLIEKVKPDFYIKGGDYTEETLPETATVKKFGGKIKFIKMTEGCSTTNIINKILDIYAK